MREILEVPKAALDIEEPWTAPARCRPVPLRRATDGSHPRLRTHVAAWYDEDYLSILFSGADDHIRATYLRHDDPLYEEDVVEVFVAPNDAARYYELEINPRGTMFDAQVESPDGVRATMHVDRGWTCEGLFAAVRTTAEGGRLQAIDILVRIPFFALERSTPGFGETWRANFFRIDRHSDLGDEFMSWQPSLKSPADFHVVSAFGTLRFVE